MARTFLLRALRASLRCSRALWAFIKSLPQHVGQKGDHLPSLPWRMIEQGRLLFVSGLTPTNYYRYRLYRKDMSFEAKAMFLGFFEGWRWQVAVNRSDAGLIVFDKILCSRFLDACGVPQPRCLGVFGLPGGPLDSSAAERAGLEFDHFIIESAKQAQGFFLKPVYGRAGRGHISVGPRTTGSGGWQLLPRKEPVTPDELRAKLVSARIPYMAQERMVPHPDLACFGTDVLHTIRMITILDGDVQIAQAALKIGCGQTPMDNTLKGNIVAGVHLASGILRPGFAMDKSGGIAVPRPVDFHPLTGARIAGHQLPLWNETLQMLKGAARHFHLLSMLAWDVAITNRGPVVIEANTNPDLFLTQMANEEGLLATPLGSFLHRHQLLDRVGVGLGLTAVYERMLRHKGAAQESWNIAGS